MRKKSLVLTFKPHFDREETGRVTEVKNDKEPKQLRLPVRRFQPVESDPMRSELDLTLKLPPEKVVFGQSIGKSCQKFASPPSNLKVTL